MHVLAFLISEFWTRRNPFLFIIPSDLPNVAICGSFFHFPKETGGLIHVTMLCRRRSPIDRSATWQCNQNMNIHSPVNLYVTEHTVGPHLSMFTSFFSLLCSVMSWSNTAPYSSWIFCISLMWLATLFMALTATNAGKTTIRAELYRESTCFHFSNVGKSSPPQSGM